jgi:hypothetical protein
MRKLLIFISLILFVRFSFAQTGFEKTYSNATGAYVIQAADGNFVVAGNTSQFSAGSSDVFLLKINSSGDTLWSMLYGGTGDDRGIMVRQTSDGGYIIAARTNSFGAGINDYYLIKTDAAGLLTWSKIYSGTGVNGEVRTAKSVEQTSDGGYILAGTTPAFNYFLIKTDANGDTLWTKSYGGFDYENGYGVRQTPDGGYILAGTAQSFGGGIAAYFVKTNSSGAVTWSKIYYGASQLMSQVYSLDLASDGGYIAAGRTNNYGAGIYDCYLLKTTSAGVVQWSKTYGGADYDECYSVKQLSNGGYILSGYTLSFGAGAQDYYVIKTNSSGVMTWSSAFGGSGYEVASSSAVASDGGHVITGLGSVGATGMYTIKVDSLGSGSCHATAVPTSEASQVTIEAAVSTTLYNISMNVTAPATVVHSGVTVYTHCLPVCTAACNVLNNIYCYGDCNASAYVTNSAGTPPYTYSWIPSGGTGQTATGLCPGNYTCSVTDSVGCSTFATVVLTEPLPVMASSTVNHASCSSCSDGSVFVSVFGGTGIYSYSWTPSVSTSATASSLFPGIYTCCVNDANGCTDCIIDTVSYPTSVETLFANHDFFIHPNPFGNELIVTCSGNIGTGKSISVCLFDITGKEILRSETSEEETHLNTGKIAAGFYLLRVGGENYKVVKQ